MTQPRPWPNEAREARDRSAEEAISAMKALDPLLEGTTFTEEEKLRRIAKAYKSLSMIARFLEKVGAQTRPV